MLKKIFTLVLWLVLLLALAAGCWLVTLYRAWPLWAAPLLFLGVLLAGWLLVVARRHWIAWRLRRKLARGMHQPAREPGFAELDAQWKGGVQRLSQSRLARHGSPMYALPWVMVLDAADPAGQRRAPLLAATRLDTQPTADRGQDPTLLSWMYLRHSVVLEPAASVVADASGRWRRLLHWLMRTRRREPLNGVAMTVDARWLLQASDADLADAGQRLRARLDDLVRIFDARMPVWLVVTGAQGIPGFVSWGQSLDDSLREQPFGFTDSDETQGRAGASGFLPAAFAALAQRLFELRLAQGRHTQPDADAFELPQRIAELQPRLARLLTPAFDATPYAETPLLRGLYLVAEAPGEGVATPWFTQGLFDLTLPAQRYAWQPLEHWRHWRRLLRHAAAVGWLALCGAVALVLLYAWRDTRDDLAVIAARPPQNLQSTDSLEANVQALNRWRSTTVGLADDDPAWHRWLPFNHHLADVDARYKQRFVQGFGRDVMTGYLDPLTARSLSTVSRAGTDRQVAAWAQFLVRRINLLLAAQRGDDLFVLPRPGRDLAQLYAGSTNRPVSDETAELIGQLYTYYLAWQTDPVQRQAELDALRANLLQLGLSSRAPGWLLAWAELQPALRPVTLQDYWNIPPDPAAPQVPAGLTADGARAVLAFLGEIASATGNHSVWDQKQREFEARYAQAAQDAWYRFAGAFVDARQRLPDATAWRSVLSSLFTTEDPHLRLLHAMAEAFEDLPAESRPAWVARTVGLSQVVSAAGAGPALGLLDKARVTSAVGGAELRALQGATAVPQGIANVRGSLDTAQAFDRYRSSITTAVGTILQGPGNAQQVAADTWAFGHDPNVKTTDLWTAQQQFTLMRQQMPVRDAREDVAWSLLRGPLAFSVDFAGRSAACQLQQDWEANVLSAVQGVSDPSVANTLLYGERGQVPAFLAGPVKNFLDRDTTRYRARMALGDTLPLNGQFYAFVSNIQLQQVQQASASHQEQEATQARAVRVQTLQQQIAALQKEQAALPALAGAVTIESVPPRVTPGARALPERTTLTLQCANGPVVLENYNFPSSRVFNWAAAACGDTTVRVEFPGFAVNHIYPGTRGFVDFLRDYASGLRRYTPADFPAQRDALQSAGIDGIDVGWTLSGQSSILSNVAALDRVTAQLARLQAEVDALQIESTQAQAPVALPAELVHSIPARIVTNCWGAPALPITAQAAPPPHAGTRSGRGFQLSSPLAVHERPARPAREPAPAAAPAVRTREAPAPAAPRSRFNQVPADARLPIPLSAGAPTSEPAAASTPRAPSGTSTGARATGLGAQGTAQPTAMPPVPASTSTPAPSTSAASPAAEPASPADAAFGWTVQVGLFSEPLAAQRRLHALGYAYQAQTIERGGRTLQRISVGGFASRAEANAAAARIGQALSLKATVQAAGG